MKPSLQIHLTLPFLTPHVHTSILYISFSIPALELGSSVCVVNSQVSWNCLVIWKMSLKGMACFPEGQFHFAFPPLVQERLVPLHPRHHLILLILFSFSLLDECGMAPHRGFTLHFPCD